MSAEYSRKLNIGEQSPPAIKRKLFVIRYWLKALTKKIKTDASSNYAGRRTLNNKDRCVIQLCWERK